jgi:ankyrin repeat protein
MVRILLGAGAKVDKVMQDRRTVLHFAAMNSAGMGAPYFHAVDLLLDAGADLYVNHFAPDGNALFAAIRAGSEEMVSLLLSMRSSLQSRHVGHTALMAACAVPDAQRRLNITGLVLGYGGTAIINYSDVHGASALSYAIAAADGKDPAATPTEHALEADNDAAVVRLLLDAGADACAADDQGVTHLVAAVRGEHRRIVDELLASGAARDVDACAPGGMPALHWAVRSADRRLVQTLLAARADPCSADAEGNSALLVAAGAGKPMLRMLQLLLAAGGGTDINEPAYGHGHTPLTAAVAAGCLEAVRLLRAAGADLETLSGEGKTAMAVALESRHVPMTGLLLDLGALVRRQDVLALMERARVQLLRAFIDRGVDVFALPGVPAAVAKAAEHPRTLARLLTLYTGLPGELLDREDAQGGTALLYAIYAGASVPVLATLIQAGARADVANCYGITPMMALLRIEAVHAAPHAVEAVDDLLSWRVARFLPLARVLMPPGCSAWHIDPVVGSFLHFLLDNCEDDGPSACMLELWLEAMRRDLVEMQTNTETFMCE